jgi:hypothetical protein
VLYVARGSSLTNSDSNLIAATFILNDDVDSAEDGLANGKSTFHNVGAAPLLRGVT